MSGKRRHRAGSLPVPDPGSAVAHPRAQDTDDRANSAPAPEALLFQMLSGYTRTQMIYVAAALGIADALQHGPLRAADLAAQVGADDVALGRLMRGLAQLGVFAQAADGRYALAPVGACLRSSVPGSLREWALGTGELRYGAWAGLLDGVRHGTTPFKDIHGMSVYAYLERHPELADRFSRSMTDLTGSAAGALLDVCDFSTAGVVVDVGGGYGTLLAAILTAHPHLKGIVYDAPHVAAEASRRLAEAGLSGRCAVEGGDFLEAVPRGGDLYILSWVLLDWDDAHCLRLLGNCYAAMPPHGRLVIFDAVMPDAAGPTRLPSQDLSMFVMTGGRVRTAAELTALLAAARFEVARITPTSLERSVIEAVPLP